MDRRGVDVCVRVVVREKDTHNIHTGWFVHTGSVD